VSRTDPETIAALFEEAERALAEERTRTDEERQAMEAFAAAVRNISPTVAPTRESHQALQVRAGSNTTAFDSIRAAYRSTFMAVAHYEEDYDETYVESITEEFGPDVAVLLATGMEFTEFEENAPGLDPGVESDNSLYKPLSGHTSNQ